MRSIMCCHCWESRRCACCSAPRFPATRCCTAGDAVRCAARCKMLGAEALRVMCRRPDAETAAAAPPVPLILPALSSSSAAAAAAAALGMRWSKESVRRAVNALRFSPAPPALEGAGAGVALKLTRARRLKALCTRIAVAARAQRADAPPPPPVLPPPLGPPPTPAPPALASETRSS